MVIVKSSTSNFKILKQINERLKFTCWSSIEKTEARQLQPQGKARFYEDPLGEDTIVADRQFWHLIAWKSTCFLYSWVAADQGLGLQDQVAISVWTGNKESGQQVSPDSSRQTSKSRRWQKVQSPCKQLALRRALQADWAARCVMSKEPRKERAMWHGRGQKQAAEQTLSPCLGKMLWHWDSWPSPLHSEILNISLETIV